jgi:hypothetical protein
MNAIWLADLVLHVQPFEEGPGQRIGQHLVVENIDRRCNRRFAADAFIKRLLA